VLFMQSMKKRISGELEVATSVRYADVPTTKKRAASVRVLLNRGGGVGVIEGAGQTDTRV
jgi:hypothetical protein